jgi:hypothetical protein
MVEIVILPYILQHWIVKAGAFSNVNANGTVIRDENFPGIPGFSSDFRGFPEWVFPIRPKKRFKKKK